MLKPVQLPTNFGNYEELHDSISTRREGSEWWLLTEETLANSAYCNGPHRLGWIEGRVH